MLKNITHIIEGMPVCVTLSTLMFSVIVIANKAIAGRQGAIRAVTRAMLAHVAHENVQELALEVLRNLTTVESEAYYIRVAAVVVLMQSDPCREQEAGRKGRRISTPDQDHGNVHCKPAHTRAWMCGAEESC